MDNNILEILFFLLIFILSGLSSYFEKKKKGKLKHQGKTKPDSTGKENAKDILEQILGYVPEKPEPRKIELPPKEKGTWNPEEEFNTKSDSKIEESTPTEFINAEVEEPELEMKIAHDFKNEYSGFQSKEKFESQYRNRILEKIKEPESLRELILFSEILGKPKALRR